MKKNIIAILSLVVLLGAGVCYSASSPGYGGGPAGPGVDQLGSDLGPSGDRGIGRMARGPHGKWKRGRAMKEMEEKLGLTAEQKDRVRALKVAFLENTRKARTDQMGLKDQKKTMMISGKIDLKKLAEIDDQLVKYRTKLMKERLKMRRERLALFSPEQLKVVADFYSKGAMRSMFRRGRGRR